MKFNFKIQQYQTDAVDSVVGVFKGQPYSDPVNYRRDIGKVKSSVSYSQMSFVDSMFEQQELNLTDDFDDAGFKKISLAYAPPQNPSFAVVAIDVEALPVNSALFPHAPPCRS